MKINEEEWKEMTFFPQKGQKCKVLILKEMTFEGKAEEGNYKWQEDKQGEHRLFAWKALAKDNEKNE